MPVKPGKYNPTKPDIELFDFKTKKRVGLKLEGSGALQIGTISQDDSVHVRAAGKRVGDFDEQRSWKGGRGHERQSENPEGYWDSMNAWTLSAGRIHPTLLYRHARGIKPTDIFEPDKTHSMAWRALLGSSRYVSMSWSSSGLTANYGRLWLRRVGSPGTLTVKLYTNNAGNPGTQLEVDTLDINDITDFVSVFKSFSTNNRTLTAGIIYHVVVYGDSGDSKSNHWEIGGYSGGSTGKQSSDGSSWSSASFDPYYYFSGTDVQRRFWSFFLDEAMYLVDKKDIGGSDVWINGSRGKATSGAANGLIDSSQSWVADRWVGAWIKIVRGTGSGQTREITANTATAVTCSGNWIVQPDTTSEFVIYATAWFTLLTAGLSGVTGQPLNNNNIVYFPQGPSVNIRWMVWNSTTKAHEFGDDGSNRASFLERIQTDNVFILRAVNDTTKYVSVAPEAAYSVTPTALVFGSARNIGSSAQFFNGTLAKGRLAVVFKEDSVSYVDNLLNVTMLESGMDKTPHGRNGYASISHGQFMYYSWLHSLIRVYGSSHDDIGQDWSGYGLPDGREGFFSSLDTYTSLLVAGVNALSGTSSVLSFDGVGWHEIFRAYDSNKQVTWVKIQPCDATRNRTWIALGDDVVYQEMPYLKGTPRLDAGVRYQHEAVIESSAIDMGTASGLAKFIKELTVFTENMSAGDIAVDFQTDDDVGTSNWTHASVLYEAPEATCWLGLENIRQFAYRLRIRQSDNTTPITVLGVVPNGYARVPFKMVWTLRCRADNITSRGQIMKPDALMRWLLDASRFPGKVEMLSQYELAHKFNVIIHPPRMFPYKPATAGQSEESVFTLVLEEA